MMLGPQRLHATHTHPVALLGDRRCSQTLLGTEDGWANGITPERPGNDGGIGLGGLLFFMKLFLVVKALHLRFVQD